VAHEKLNAREQFLEHLAAALSVSLNEIMSYELNVFDTQQGTFWALSRNLLPTAA